MTVTKGMKLKLFETPASSTDMRRKRGKFSTLSSGKTTRNLKALGNGILMWTSHDVFSMHSIVIILTSLRQNLLFDKWQVNGYDESATSSLARHRRGRRSSEGGNVMNHSFHLIRAIQVTRTVLYLAIAKRINTIDGLQPGKAVIWQVALDTARIIYCWL